MSWQVQAQAHGKPVLSSFGVLPYVLRPHLDNEARMPFPYLFPVLLTGDPVCWPLYRFHSFPFYLTAGRLGLSFAGIT